MSKAQLSVLAAFTVLATGCSYEQETPPSAQEFASAGPQAAKVRANAMGMENSQALSPVVAPAASQAAQTAPAPDSPAPPAAQLFPNRMPPPKPSAVAEQERLWPEGDDWPSEKLLARVEPKARALLAAVLDFPRVQSACAEDFLGSSVLVPPDLDSFEHAGVRVQRAKSLAPELLDPKEFQAQWQALAAAFAPGETPALHVQFVSVESQTSFLDSYPFPFEIEALIEWVQPLAGRSVQAKWRMGWRLLAPDQAQLLSIQAQAFHAIQGRPLFLEATQAVFGDNACWDSDFRHGVHDTFQRLDRQAGVAFQGMQGLAVGDVNGDGHDDVYVPQQVGLANRLFLRGEDGKAKDVSQTARVALLDVTRAALLVDLDNDGHQDLVASVANSILIRFGDGRGVFPAEGQQWLLAKGSEQFYSLAAADPDRDGDLDVYACRYSLGGVMHGAPRPYHDAQNGASNYYWRNEGKRTFVDGTSDAGLDQDNSRFSLGAVWEDLNGDGHIDLYVVNDFGRNNAFVNDGKGRFQDRAASLGVEDLGAGMGASFGDFDRDGDLDLYVTNMFSAPGLRTTKQALRWMDGKHEAVRPHYIKHASGNSLLRRDGEVFVDVTQASQTAMGRWAWGSMFTDLDGDSWPDLVVPNGQTTSASQPKDAEGYFWRRVVAQSPTNASESEAYKAAFDAIQEIVMNQDLSWNGNERNVAYLNLGDGTFADVSAVAGLDQADDARCVALLDWDGDMREDLLFKNRTAPRLRLLLGRAQGPSARLALDLTGKTCNRDAIGALVEVEVDGQRAVKRLWAGSGYLCQSSKQMLFTFSEPLAKDARARVQVHWPDGTQSIYEDLALGQRHGLVQGEVKPTVSRGPAAQKPLFEKPSVAKALPGKVERVILVERAPMAPYSIPSFAWPQRTVRDLAGKNLLLVLFQAQSVPDQERMKQVIARAGDFASANTRIVALAVDEGPTLARARALLKGTPAEEDAGFVDERTKAALEILCLEVLGPWTQFPLPSAFLLDGAGQLSALYIGFSDLDTMLADSKTLASMPTDRGSTIKLEGGLWLFPRRRDFQLLHDVYKNNGFDTLAAWFATWAQKTAAPK